MSSKVIRASKIANGPIMPMVDGCEQLPPCIEDAVSIKAIIASVRGRIFRYKPRWWETSLALKSLKLIVIIKKYSTGRLFVLLLRFLLHSYLSIFLLGL